MRLSFLTKYQHDAGRRTNAGLTLMELVVVLLIISVMSMVLYPILVAGVNVFIKIAGSSSTVDEANITFSYLDKIFKNSVEIQTMSSSQLNFKIGTDVYDLDVSSATGLAPYAVYFKKNSGSYRVIGTNVAEFTLNYYDALQATTNVTANVKAIQATYSIIGADANHTFRTAWSFEANTEYLK